MDSNRKPIPSMLSLRSQVDETELLLRSLLQIDLEDLKTDEELHGLATNIKKLFDQYSGFSHDLSSRTCAQGAVSESLGIRKERASLRADVNETIKIICSLKSNLNAEAESLVGSTLSDRNDQSSLSDLVMSKSSTIADSDIVATRKITPELSDINSATSPKLHYLRSPEIDNSLSEIGTVNVCAIAQACPNDTTLNVNVSSSLTNPHAVVLENNHTMPSPGTIPKSVRFCEMVATSSYSDPIISKSSSSLSVPLEVNFPSHSVSPYSISANPLKLSVRSSASTSFSSFPPIATCRPSQSPLRLSSNSLPISSSPLTFTSASYPPFNPSIPSVPHSLASTIPRVYTHSNPITVTTPESLPRFNHNYSSIPPVTFAYNPPVNPSLAHVSQPNRPRSNLAYPYSNFSHSFNSSGVNHDLPNSIVGSPLTLNPMMHQHQFLPHNDTASYHMLRQEILKPSGKPFSGEPHEYHCWMNVISNKLKGIELEAWDILTVLHSNSTGKPQKLIEQHMAIGGVDPSQTLQNVSEALFDQFGSGTQIANSLMSKIASFPIIKDSHNIEQLRELLSLSQLILVNMPASSELQYFNLALGLRQLWEKLPFNLQNKWREYAANFLDSSGFSGHPPFDHFVVFLQKRCKELGNESYLRPMQAYTRRTSGLVSSKRTSDFKSFKTDSASTSPPVKIESPKVAPLQKGPCCPIHTTGKHPLSVCKVFAKLPFQERREILLKSGLCFKCFGEHRQKDCTVDVSCSICKKPHATVMHRHQSTTNNLIKDSIPPNSSSQNKENVSNFCSKLCDSPNGKNCSKTLLVDITLPHRSTKSLRCYCIIDEQSSCSFVDPRVKEFFNFSFPVQEYNLTTLSGSSISSHGYIIEGLRVKGVGQKKSIQLPPVYTNEFIPNCKNEVASPSIVSQHNHIAHLSKNFTNPDSNCDVLVLVGRDCGAAMSTKCFGFKAPYAHHTPLGWALVGETCPNANSSVLKSSVSVLKSCTYDPHMSASPRFLEKTEICSPNVLDIFCEKPDDELPGISKNEEKFLSILQDNITTDENNNIVMPLPFKKDDPIFPDNRLPVYHRTKNTLERLKARNDKLKQCLASMEKSLINDHVEPVPESELAPSKPGKTWYVPVFAVTQERKNKTRLVFDSSAVYCDTSLNKELLQGPDINNQLRTVLLRFRRKPIGFSADIESMFYAFRLYPKDRDFTRFFWWRNNDPSQDIIEYRAKVHIFGNTSSPALANIGLRYAVSQNPLTSQPVKEFVSHNFYVDDACGCAYSPEEAIKTLSSTKEILSSNNIRLHKIISNSSEVIDHFPSTETSVSTSAKNFDDCSSQQTLGVEWNIASDNFVIRCNVPERPFSKRGILSTNNSMYDPLGFVSPITLSGRILQRQLVPSVQDNPTIASLMWDEPLPSELLPLWEEWKSSLSAMDGLLAIPRSFIPKNFGSLGEQTLHIFSDASHEGTGHVCYIRSTNDFGKCHVAFVNASSCITPRGSISVPRLELCAALDAALSAQQTACDLEIPPENVHLYSDSKIVLGYLNNSTTAFSRYVTRRVSLILKCFPASQWSYINTTINPADIASRPQSYQSLIKSCWFFGPPFIHELSSLSADSDLNVELPEKIEPKSTCKIVANDSAPIFIDLCSRIGSWLKFLRISQLVFSYIAKLSKRISLKKGCQSPFPEVSLAATEQFIIKSFQVNIANSKAILSLSPFHDTADIIRVGGRLKNSELPFHLKHPILIPSGPLSTCIISHFHSKTKHQGRVITMAAIRNAGYFLQSGSNSVKKFLNSCLTCKMLRSKPLEQKMCDLPYDRLKESTPFTFTGMDVFGPFMVSDGRTTRRNTCTKKTWAIVFTCLVSRAVHIEPLPSLDISSFKNALQRFFCLRGSCRKLRCDRGTNFVGAHGQETSLSLEQLNSDPSFSHIEWDFNPPKASHFGGTWERKISSIKRILDTSLLQLKS